MQSVKVPLSNISVEGEYPRQKLHENQRIPESHAGGLGDNAVDEKLQGKWLREATEEFRKPTAIFVDEDGHRFAQVVADDDALSARHSNYKVAGVLPALYPEWLGARQFAQECSCRFPYVVGEMAQGIATADMVVAAVDAGFLGFFGSAGLRPEVIQEEIRNIRSRVGRDASWGANLIHTPGHPDRERQTVDVFLEEGVRNVSAAAFMKLSREVVRFSAKGLSLTSDGELCRSTRVFAKVSRPEVVAAFLAPPPEAMLNAMVEEGCITVQEAALQSRLPVAEYITIEADSGGHTDNRPLASLFPVISQLRTRLVEKYGYTRPVFLGAAGGIGTPAAAASAFALGADYIVTGSINQSAVESGLAEAGKALLCSAGIADMTMAPSADMFEMGVKVQVLKRGTMFAAKAQRLYDIYRRYDRFDQIPKKDIEWLEAQVLRETVNSAWQNTRAHHAAGKPELIARADQDEHLQMALIFKRYLFQGSQWARNGHADRTVDYQIWCGPAMGAFNEWTSGSLLEAPENRSVGQIGLNILEGAAQLSRAHQLRIAGVGTPPNILKVMPRLLALG